jgi:hypothetical protein
LVRPRPLRHAKSPCGGPGKGSGGSERALGAAT